jgi:phosphatidylserine decarboxylase
MGKNLDIKYIDRNSGETLCESVSAGFLVKGLYASWGRIFTGPMSLPLLSKLVGWYQNRSISRRGIRPFVLKHGIRLEEFSPVHRQGAPYRNFNEFFIREFSPGQRSFPQEGSIMGAFAEGRYLACSNFDEGTSLPIKGVNLGVRQLMGDSPRANEFIGGPALICRLCPVDYHRFHFPDEGSLGEHYRLGGRFHSVNPLALRCKGDIWFTNERQVSILETAHFKKLAMIEVGAMCVGKIVQIHSRGQQFGRGDQKGYFLFGGSTVIVIGEKGAWSPSEDLLVNTSRGFETLVRLGDRVAKSNHI